VTDPQVIWRRLTVSFARSVSFPNQVPALMEVMVFPLAEPSSPVLGATFVNPVGVQQVSLVRDTDIVFELIPSHLAGLTGELLYRIQWRAGVTGRTFTFDFAMPDQDINFDQLSTLGNIIDGEVYLRNTDLGVPGRVARLNVDGHVVDATGSVLATVGAVDSISGALQAERIARTQADAAVAAQAESALDAQISSVLSTTAANLSGAVASLNATLLSDRNGRISGDLALGVRIDDVIDSVTALSSSLTGKADLVGGKIPLAQIPDAARTQGITVANEAAMLALTLSQVQQFDFAIRPDGIWALMGTNPANLSHWVQLNKVSSVNGRTGAVTINLNDAASAGGYIEIGQVNGLTSALDNAANSSALTTLGNRVTAIETDSSIVKLVSGVIPHTLNSDRMAYINNSGQVTNKAGQVIVVPGSGSVTEVNGASGVVTVNLTSAAAQGGAVPLAQVTGLATALGDKVDTTDARLSNSRTPTAHASSHGALGADPLVLALSQVSGLSTILTNNGLTGTSNHENRIAALELGGGGGGGGGEIAKAAWFDGTATFGSVTVPANFQNIHGVLLKSPFSVNTTTGNYTYTPGGVKPVGDEYVWPYISPNGHLEFRKWDEAAAADPALATQAALDALTTTVGTKANQSALTALTTTVNGKADQSALTTLSTTVSGKADAATVTTLTSVVNGKADATVLTALTTTVDGKAEASAVTALTATVATKANQNDLTALTTTVGTKANQSDLSALTTTVGTKANQSDMTAAQSAITALQTGKADLVGGKVPSSQLPSVALSTVTVVANKAAMLAQTTTQVQPGDITVITATVDKGNYILSGDGTPATEGNWVKLVVPDGNVASVNGQSGAVILGAADVGARSLSTLLAISDTSGLQAALDAKASTTALTTGLAGKASPADVQALLSSSVPIKMKVDRVSTTNVLSRSGPQSIDGSLVSSGQLVLLAGQTNPIDNGVWLVQAGSWARPSDFSVGSWLVRGTVVIVGSGATNANTIWQQTSASGTVGTNNNGWSLIGYCAPPFAPVAGNGVDVSGSTFAVKPDTTGAAKGISVSSAGVAVDPTVVVRKATGIVPAGSTTVTLTHNLNTLYPLVQIIEVGSGNLVLAGVTTNNQVNSVQVEFASAPGSSQYRWVVIG
jgi:hypothetical protein